MDLKGLNLSVCITHLNGKELEKETREHGIFCRMIRSKESFDFRVSLNDGLSPKDRESFIDSINKC